VIDKEQAGHRMLNVVRAGGAVAMIIDQHVRPSAAIRVPFLGHAAWTSPLLAMLSLRTGAPVVPFRCLPAPQHRYRVEIHPPIEPEGKGRPAEAAMTPRYVEPIERDVLERPELWLWMHRRWREE
jgi:KDO2-lipid IV(A) lauroyltransferase